MKWTTSLMFSIIAVINTTFLTQWILPLISLSYPHIFIRECSSIEMAMSAPYKPWALLLICMTAMLQVCAYVCVCVCVGMPQYRNCHVMEFYVMICHLSRHSIYIVSLLISISATHVTLNESDASESITWPRFKSLNAHFGVHYLDNANFSKTNGCFG